MESLDHLSKLQPWPDAMTPAELKRKKTRDDAFDSALRQVSAASRWRFGCGSMFTDQHGWYLANLPKLAYRQGVVMCLCYKPMAMDPLFWEIAGLSVDSEKSLPFRNQVPYAICAAQHHALIGADTESVHELAELTLSWTNDWFRLNESRLDVEDMLQRLGNLEQASTDERVFAIFLAIFRRDLDTAADLTRLCESAPVDSENCDDRLSLVRRDGTQLSIYDKTRNWLASEQRRKLCLVN